ncbi:hypothetical protein DXC17_17035, partial [Phocaeicola plebeius]
GRLDARRTLKSLVADLRVNKMILNILILIRIKIKIYIINNPSKRENSSFEQLGYIIIMWY